MNKLNLEMYEMFESAYDLFNETLFGNSLPSCIITLNTRKRSRGFYWSKHFRSRIGDEIVSEIALNPDEFSSRTDIEILSTMVHEMCHAFQDLVNGSAPKKAYHDREWVSIMESIGLIPSASGEAGGKKTGVNMSHYIDPEGKFKKIAELFLSQNKIIWNGFLPEGNKIKSARKKSKYKFTCPTCGQNAWGKEDTLLICGNCETTMSIAE